LNLVELNLVELSRSAAFADFRVAGPAEQRQIAEAVVGLVVVDVVELERHALGAATKAHGTLPGHHVGAKLLEGATA
jgi:hypothetical protein